MEATLHFLRGGGHGGGGSSGVSVHESIVCEAEAVEKKYLGQSENKSSFSVEGELDLGLCLSIGGGVGLSSSSSSSPFPATIRISSGIKRGAESVSKEGQGGSLTGSSEVVGWPPVRSYRMNNLVNQTKADALKKKVCEGKQNLGFVKVSMDGVLIGRKLDLNSHSSYQSLALILHHMFFNPTSSLFSNGEGGDKEEWKKSSRLLDGSAEFVLIYEDKDGDWMLVGDVPWRMFVGSVKKLRIMRSSDAKGLSPRCEGR